MSTIYGTTTVNGQEIELTGDADFTGRQLEGGYTNYNEATDGESYDVEMSAPGIDSDGNKVTVYWMFSFVKGAEPELDSLNWETADSVEIW